MLVKLRENETAPAMPGAPVLDPSRDIVLLLRRPMLSRILLSMAGSSLGGRQVAERASDPFRRGCWDPLAPLLCNAPVDAAAGSALAIAAALTATWRKLRNFCQPDPPGPESVLRGGTLLALSDFSSDDSPMLALLCCH